MEPLSKIIELFALTIKAFGDSLQDKGIDNKL